VEQELLPRTEDSCVMACQQLYIPHLNTREPQLSVGWEVLKVAKCLPDSANTEERDALFLQTVKHARPRPGLTNVLEGGPG